MTIGNYLKMPDKRRVLVLLELGWSYRRIERETGVRRETVARYDPRRKTNAANLSTGAESTSDELADGESNAANVSAGSSHAHGPPGVAEDTNQGINDGFARLRRLRGTMRVVVGTLGRLRLGWVS